MKPGGLWDADHPFNRPGNWQRGLSKRLRNPAGDRHHQGVPTPWPGPTPAVSFNTDHGSHFTNGYRPSRPSPMYCKEPLSRSLITLIELTERLLETEITIRCLKDAPYRGVLVDPYTHETDVPVIVASTSYLGMLKDYIIARHVVTLLLRGAADARGDYRILSYDQDSLSRGMRQIYLDILKEDSARGQRIETRKLLQILFELYTYFHEGLAEVPWDVIVNRWLYLHCPKMRQAQLYYLVKESKRDMAKLLEFKDTLPHKFFVVSKAIYYTRDLYLAEVLPSIDLSPTKNIPQMRRFENLDLKEMLTNRWTRSSWYKTKLVGDRMVLTLRDTFEGEVDTIKDVTYFKKVYDQGRSITDLWSREMHMDDWFIWNEPSRHAEMVRAGEGMNREALVRIFGNLLVDEADR